jgi:hypothetical protein
MSTEAGQLQSPVAIGVAVAVGDEAGAPTHGEHQERDHGGGFRPARQGPASRLSVHGFYQGGIRHVGRCPQPLRLHEAHRLAFITARGLPWEFDPLAKRESLLLQQRATEDALQLQLEEAKEKEAVATASGRPAAPEGTVVGEETLELVKPFDLSGDR